MNATHKIHCPSCGMRMEFPSEKEGTTDVCPSCKKPVWLSHLAENNDSNRSKKFESSSEQKPHQVIHGSNPIITSLLVVLVVFNLILAFQVSQLKAQIKPGIRPNVERELQSVANLPAGKSNLLRRAQSLNAKSETMSNQELMDLVLRSLEILDEDLRTELTDLQSGLLTHSESINGLMGTAEQMNASIETLYEDLSNVSTTLDQLSSTLADVQENQLIMQNILNQSR